MTDPQSKTIRQVLKKYGYSCEAIVLGTMPKEKPEKIITLDQALSDISKIIDEAKPEYESQNGRKHRYFGNDHKNGFRLGARQYQSNLKERLK